MSLEKDITEIRKIAEQESPDQSGGSTSEDLFKPATPEEAKYRRANIPSYHCPMCKKELLTVNARRIIEYSYVANLRGTEIVETEPDDDGISGEGEDTEYTCPFCSFDVTEDINL